MMTIAAWHEKIKNGGADGFFERVYGPLAFKQKERYLSALEGFKEVFSCDDNREVALFSAPGRTEIGGNHTDHNHGCVLAASVNLDVIAVAAKNNGGSIRVKSQGHDWDIIEDCENLAPVENETGRSASLVRGVAARLRELGYTIGGFDAYTTSDVLKGSGVSSSAAFEVLLCNIIANLFGDGINPVLAAQVAQYAENVYFGKPCGLMDQMASSVGNIITIDFKDPASPIIEQVDFDFASCGHALCIVDTGGNHADLTDDYAAIRTGMESAAGVFQKPVLRDVAQREFFANIKAVRQKCGDRAVLRAMHFYADNARVGQQVDALKSGNFEAFKKLIIESGQSSFMYNQNVFTCKYPEEQGVSLALAVSEQVLRGKGAWRVHGGGFAGTIQAFVPNGLLDEYKAKIEALLGVGSCHVLAIRPVGGIKIEF